MVDVNRAPAIGRLLSPFAEVEFVSFRGTFFRELIGDLNCDLTKEASPRSASRTIDVSLHDDFSSLNSLYSKLSIKASQLASMIFSLTPTVPQTSSPSRDSITTRTRAAVPARALTTRTL